MSDFVARFDALFGGRRDNYARGRAKEGSDKFEWPRVKRPLDHDTLKLHLKGDICVGIYPIVDGKVNWFGVDFDGPRDKLTKELVPNAYELALTEALKQFRVFEEIGLQVYLERSRSGNGLHIWGFLSEWTDAATVRRAIEPLLISPARVGPYDRLYPVQDSADDLGEKLGNLLALPFYGAAVPEGRSVFLDPRTQEPINPRKWIEAVYKNVPAIIEELAEKSPKAERNGKATLAQVLLQRDELITGATKMLSPYGCRFMRHCWENRRALGEEEWYTAIGQCTYFEHGRELAHALSRDYPKYSARETDRKFDHAMKSPARGCQYIHEKFPELACAGCPMKAPYHTAKKSIIELAGESPTEMEALGNFAADLELVREFNAGARTAGVSWGIPTMDSMTLLRPSELTIVAGDPNIGKTWLLVDVAYRTASLGNPVFIFSPETSRAPLRRRFLSRSSQIELQRLRGESPMKLTREDYERLERAAADLENLPIYTDFTTLSPESVLDQVERTLLSKQLPLDSPYVVIFDYLQFGLREPGEDERQHISRSVGEFKYACKILEHPAMLFSQLRRPMKEDTEPSMHQLAESSYIERNADVIVIVKGERASGLYAPRSLYNVKQREGEAQKKLDFVLHQAYGKWEAPRKAENLPREDLTKDFNV